jgi:tRNA pseudouridine13 synthase
MSVNLLSDDDAKELQVGITTFVDDAREKFQGILKKRYTDFLVNEILPDGRVLHLQSMNVKDGANSAPNNDEQVPPTANEQVQPQDAVSLDAPVSDATADAPANEKSADGDAAPGSEAGAANAEVRYSP